MDRLSEAAQQEAKDANPATPGAVLVTGAARRIGRAIALDLARHGWRVAVHYGTSGAEAEEVVGEIRDAGGKAVALHADLVKESEVERLVPDAAAALGPLTCLVNNASTFVMDTADTVTRQSWDAHIEANLRAPFVLSQAFARQLPRDWHGNIVNLLDERVWKLTPYFISYTVSKMGLWTLTRTLALALAPRIRVNGIGPGPALPSPRQSDAQFAELCASMPLRHGTTPQEIAEAVRFILSAPAMTGQMIALDSGQHLSWHLPAHGKTVDE
jgi:NAD(P)-dependent dehydrogenase (short-subunit alcohol dehydrogenase family)